MIESIGYGIRRARKSHQCFECYRTIEAKTEHHFQTNIYDDRIYTLYSHLDCNECASLYRDDVGWADYDDGYPPLRDEWIDSGEYEKLCAEYRGLYPHVVARMELTDQLHEAAR